MQVSTLNLSYAAFAVCTIAVLFYRRRHSLNLLLSIRGPPSPSLLWGNLLQLMLPDNYGDFEFGWQKEYGSVYRIKGCLGQNRLIISDPLAIKHIINTPTFTHPPGFLRNAALAFGRSVASVQGDEHRRFRGAMSIGFSAKVVRSFAPIFTDVARKTIREWELLCTPGAPTTLNVCQLLDRATLDIISQAALGIHINTVQDPQHPLAKSHTNILAAAFKRTSLTLMADHLSGFLPSFIFRQIVHLPIASMQAVSAFRTVTERLIRTKADELGTQEVANDLLSTIRNGRSGNSKMTIPELTDQIRILLVAGQDPTSVILAWSLYWLAANPDFQAKLRLEIRLATENAADGQLDYDGMTLLNALVKETLRFHPAVPITERIATEDAVLPLAEAVVTSDGQRLSQLPVKKGQAIMIAIASYHRLEALWGEDAHEFNPSRWLDGNPCKGNALGPYGHLLSFLGGPRVCLGWRFGVLEAQVILSELIASFDFTLPESSCVRSRLSGTEGVPFDAGRKGLDLCLTRV
ncbi:cytochrome P450 [Roridomyces roridus]|uniref:Cytochrome P450 n=1 Tax=Roridomyces roridus TaxID=1738132 RepID=A0AAD7CK89_9AGAR|nr:cytochrome P450 [Roridomyces roridus]